MVAVSDEESARTENKGGRDDVYWYYKMYTLKETHALLIFVLQRVLHVCLYEIWSEWAELYHV